MPWGAVLQTNALTARANCGQRFLTVAHRHRMLAHQTHITSAQKFERRMRRSPLSSVVRYRCDYCGGHLWLTVYRYYHMRFCCKAHMQAYQQRLTMETRAKIRHLELLAPT